MKKKKRVLFANDEVVVNNIFNKLNGVFYVEFSLIGNKLYDEIVFTLEYDLEGPNSFKNVSYRDPYSVYWDHLIIKDLIEKRFTAIIDLDENDESNVFKNLGYHCILKIVNVQMNNPLVLDEGDFSKISKLSKAEITTFAKGKNNLDKIRNLALAIKALNRNANYFLGLIDHEEKETK